MKTIKNNWSKIREISFLILLAAEITFSLLRRTTVPWPDMIGSRLATLHYFLIPLLVLGLYGIDMLLTGVFKNIKKISIDAVIMIIFTVTAFASQDYYALATGAFLISSHMSSVKNIAKTIAGTLFAVTVVISAISLTGVIENRHTDRFGRISNAFGFRHYAWPARQFLFAELAYLYAKDKKLSWLELAGHFAAVLIIYYFTTQRLTFIIFIAVLLMYVIFVKCELIKITSKLIKICSAIGFSVCAAVSVVVSYFYDSSVVWMKKIDTMLNGRLFLGRRAFDEFDVNLLGNVIKDRSMDDPLGYLYIDCGYLDVLLTYGIIIFTIAILICTIMLYYSCCKNDTKLFVWLVSVMLYTIVDNVWLNMMGAGTVVILFAAVINEMKKDKMLRQ